MKNVPNESIHQNPSVKYIHLFFQSKIGKLFNETFYPHYPLSIEAIMWNNLANMKRNEKFFI